MRPAFFVLSAFLIPVLGWAGVGERLLSDGEAAFRRLEKQPEFRAAEVPMPPCPSAAETGPLADFSGPTLKSFKPAPLPEFADDMDRDSMVAALTRSLAYWARVPAGRKFKLGAAEVTADRLKRSNEALIAAVRASATPADLQAALRERFDAFQSIGSDGSGQATVTAYYEAELDVVALRDEAHPFPVQRKPADLARLDPQLGSPFDYGRVDERGRIVPYYTRAEMDAALAGRGLELGWTAHPTDLLILQTEGSGFLNLPGGKRQRVGFDGANGWPYRSVGRALQQCGVVPPDLTGKRLLDFLRRQPQAKEAAYVALNPRYTFFSPQSADGSFGAIGEMLTAGRSIAVDPSTVPLGAAGLLVSRLPVVDDAGHPVGSRPFSRLVALQDTGSAIRGPGRVDLFLGAGRDAMNVGHAMLYPGTLYVFVLKTTKETAWKR